ncbi:hypothetical protein GQ41_1191 [Arenibacter algicola]|uniref:Uncharacterized protein n=1 Tax=Arenibacter algicola TaxID=616991 RepID=A0ABY3A7C2_9FLAO
MPPKAQKYSFYRNYLFFGVYLINSILFRHDSRLEVNIQKHKIVNVSSIYI